MNVGNLNNLNKSKNVPVDSSVAGQKPWLVVYPYNPEGGFFWFMYNMLHAHYQARVN